MACGLTVPIRIWHDRIKFKINNSRVEITLAGYCVVFAG